MALEGIGKATCREVSHAVGRNEGNVYRDLQDLQKAGLIKRNAMIYSLPEL
jgi:predicted transcriptional regulator